MPRLTVIMPVKNCMPYLTECLASLEAQTFKDFELYVWENNSSDNTLEELKRWIPSRIPGKIFEGRELNVGESLRELVNLAPTELIARMDGDDVCKPERFEKQLAYLDKNPDIAIVGTEFDAIDPEGKTITKPWYIPCEYHEIVYQLIRGAVFVHNSVIYKKSAILAVGNYGSFRNEDHELWMRLASHYCVKNMPDMLVSYRFHDKSISQNIRDVSQYTKDCLLALSTNAPALYGISPETFIELKNRSIKYAQPILKTMLFHFQKKFNDPYPLKSQTLVVSLKTLIWIWDIRTRLWLGWKSRGAIGWFGALFGFCGDALRKLLRK